MCSLRFVVTDIYLKNLNITTSINWQIELKSKIFAIQELLKSFHVNNSSNFL